MDDILERFEIHDFFGILLPGMTFLILLYFMDFPLLRDEIALLSQTFEIILFVLASYVSGTLIQEIASWVDDKLINLRKNARGRFFFDNSKVFQGAELTKVKELVKDLLGRRGSNDTEVTPDGCSAVYFMCKAHLENIGKMDDADKYDAVYEMSRNFIVCNFFVLICLLFMMWLTSGCEGSCGVIMIYLIISTPIFGHRAVRYSKMRVRKILRQYMDLRNTEKAKSNGGLQG